MTIANAFNFFLKMAAGRFICEHDGWIWIWNLPSFFYWILIERLQMQVFFFGMQVLQMQTMRLQMMQQLAPLMQMEHVYFLVMQVVRVGPLMLLPLLPLLF